MKRIEKPYPYDKTYKRVTIYLDDIKSIYDILADTSKEVVIKTSSYLFDNWDDLVLNCKETDNLIFQVKKEDFDGPSLSVEMHEFSVRINTSAIANEKLAHLFHQLDSVLQPLARKKYFFNNIAFVVALFLLGVFLMIKPIPLIDGHGPLQPIVVLLLFAPAWFINKVVDNKTKIHLYRKGERKNLIQRTWDGVFTNIVSSFFVALISFLLGYLSNKYGWFK